MQRIKLLMIIFLFIECYTMSFDEIEDFANFLERTSRLDQNLKKGSDPNEYDDDEIISDHAWEDSGKFEGDLILNERQRRLIVENVAEGLSRNGLKDGTKRWPNNEVIYYIQKEHFSSDQMQAIQNGIDDLAQASCVKFRPYQRGDKDAVVIQGSRRGCFSQVGYQGGYQVLNLSGRHPVGRGCFRHGTIVHELLHSLGFYHMQSSPDRDDYVNIIWSNIIQQARHNFRKYNSFAVSDFGVGYDYDSVLHYSRRAFSANGQDTIVPKKVGAEIGQRVGLSDKDVQKLNKMYCDADSSNSEAGVEPKQPETKPRNSKNKPFGGHGIGYHQGKAVVIKLLPAPETYKLPDVPSFHLFDYFSKAPQAMSISETEGFRIGKEIIQPFHPAPPFNVAEYNISVQANAAQPPKTKNNELQKLEPEENIKKTNQIEKLNKEPQQEIQAPLNIILKKPETDQQPNTQPEESDESIDDPFVRLSKIIKSHVYPNSRSNNFKNTHLYYTPPKFTSKGNYEQDTNFRTTDYKKPIEFLRENSYYSSPYFAYKEVYNNQEPSNKRRKDSKVKSYSPYRNKVAPSLDHVELPEDSREVYLSKNNYSALYPAYTDKQNKNSYTFIGDDIPLRKNKWYTNVFKHNPAEYGRLINLESQR